MDPEKAKGWMAGKLEEVREFGKIVDFGKTASDYAKVGFPREMFVRLASLYGVGVDGQHVLDIGTGTGTIARSLARNGCVVTALDPSENLMKAAKQLDDQEDPPLAHPIIYVQGKIENCTLPSSSFDVIFAGQCWHWFDPVKSFEQVKRMLKPDGKLVICHFDWIPLKDSVANVTEDLVIKYNPVWNAGGGTGFYPQWTINAMEAKFTNIETFSFDIDVPYTHEGWRGRMRAMAGVAATLSEEKVREFDEELGQILKAKFEQDPLAILHRVWAMIATPPKA